MRKEKLTKICFRNDDVNLLTNELVKLTGIFINRRIPLIHALEPCNLSVETINWLKKLKRKSPELIEIVQHGWDHSIHGKGEFGKSRSYIDQYNDLLKGKKKLETIFGDDFLPCLTIPFGTYTKNTIRAANSLGYRIFCSRYRYHVSHRLYYQFGHFLRRGQLFGHHISNHLKYYPGTKLFEIDTSISFIKKYFSTYGNECEMFTAKEILFYFEKHKKRIPVVNFLLHHRYHNKKNHIDLINQVLDELQKRNDVFFVNYSRIYKEYSM